MRRGDGIILSSVLLFFFIFFLLTVQAKDLYKVLGLEKGASQHDIKKAFRRLSLKYHPDKNPSKDAQTKFADISNAYDVLSDEEKRKNYDMYGDEHGRGFDSGGSHPGGFGSSQGQSHNGRRYTSERQSWGFQGGSPFGQDGFSSSSFGSGEGGSSFSFSFGGGSSFAESILENIFGSGGGFFGSNNRKDSGGNSDHNGRQTSGSSIISASHLSSKDFGSKVLNQYYTWAVLFYPTSSAEVEEKVSVLEQVATGLRGSVKVGRVDCRSQASLCKEENLWPLKKAKLYFYSLGSTGKVRALEYVGDWSSKDIKDYCVEVLPRFSTRLKENDLTEDQMLPQAILITKKKDTPAIWRALSGLFYGRVLCFDVQAHDTSSSIVKRFKVESLPAIVGVLLNGESYVISSGSSLDQVSVSVEGLQRLLEDLEKKSMKAGPKGGKSEDKVPLLTKKNFERVCGTRSPLCVIAAFKSSNAKLKVKQILETISKKSLVRKGERLDAVENPVSYALLDATKQASFIKAFGIRALDIPEASFLIAYKPRKGKFAVYKGSSFNPEDAEDFVVGILSGDVQFKKIGKNPVLID